MGSPCGFPPCRVPCVVPQGVPQVGSPMGIPWWVPPVACPRVSTRDVPQGWSLRGYPKCVPPGRSRRGVLQWCPPAVVPQVGPPAVVPQSGRPRGSPRVSSRGVKSGWSPKWCLPREVPQRESTVVPQGVPPGVLKRGPQEGPQGFPPGCVNQGGTHKICPPRVLHQVRPPARSTRGSPRWVPQKGSQGCLPCGVNQRVRTRGMPPGGAPSGPPMRCPKRVPKVVFPKGSAKKVDPWS